MLLSTSQEWNLNLSTSKIWSGLIYNPCNYWQEATGNVASYTLSTCIIFAFCPALDRMYSFHVLSPTQPPMRLRQQTIQTLQVRIFFLCLFCLFVCFFFVLFRQRACQVENQYIRIFHSFMKIPTAELGCTQTRFPGIFTSYENGFG